MTEERYKQINDSDASMTDEEKDQGYHYCWDFDGLLVGPDGGEWAYCFCFNEEQKQRVARKYPELKPPPR